MYRCDLLLGSQTMDIQESFTFHAMKLLRTWQHPLTVLPKGGTKKIKNHSNTSVCKLAIGILAVRHLLCPSI